MAEHWAYCGPCSRWFYCDRAALLSPTCPVCLAESQRVELCRPAQGKISAS